MNANEYKARCAEPDAFPRGALEDTVRALSRCAAPPSGLIERVEAILAGPILVKPERHHDGEGSDFFSVARVSKEEAAAIADVFLDLEVGSVDVDGEVTGSGGYYATLADAWNNFAESRG